MVELFLPEDFFAVVVSECIAPPFLSFIEELEEVVVMVSLLCAHEARKAAPIRATVEERSNFFIGLVV